MWLYHEKTGDAHLTSIHAWFGFAVVIVFGIQVGFSGISSSKVHSKLISTFLLRHLLLFQWLAGLVLFLFPTTPISAKKAALPVHVLAGVYLFLMVILICCLGIIEKLTFLTDAGTITRRGADTLVGNFTAISILVWAGFVIYIVIYTEKPEANDVGGSKVQDLPVTQA